MASVLLPGLVQGCLQGRIDPTLVLSKCLGVLVAQQIRHAACNPNQVFARRQRMDKPLVAGFLYGHFTSALNQIQGQRPPPNMGQDINARE